MVQPQPRYGKGYSSYLSPLSDLCAPQRSFEGEITVVFDQGIHRLLRFLVANCYRQRDDVGRCRDDGSDKPYGSQPQDVPNHFPRSRSLRIFVLSRPKGLTEGYHQKNGQENRNPFHQNLLFFLQIFSSNIACPNLIHN